MHLIIIIVKSILFHGLNFDVKLIEMIKFSLGLGFLKFKLL